MIKCSEIKLEGIEVNEAAVCHDGPNVSQVAIGIPVQPESELLERDVEMQNKPEEP